MTLDVTPAIEGTAEQRLPVTVLSGYLGAEKTALPNRVLNNREGKRVALSINFMPEVNVNADPVRAETELSRTDETLAQMSNGCICCSLRGDLLAESLSSVQPIGAWWVSAPEKRWPEHLSVLSYIKQHWPEPSGDRRQEIVFVGSGIDRSTLNSRLDACLLPNAQARGPGILSQDLSDPFPAWRRVEEAA